jgi:predicted dehydrogenase
MVRAAVVGCGDISITHREAIGAIDGAELVALCDTTPEALAAAGEKHPGVPTFEDHRTLLDHVRPDVVHVCTPHHQHVPVAIDALDAGVDVLTEKPVAHTLVDADRLIDATEKAHRESGARIAVSFQNRYNRPVQRLHELLENGDLGMVQAATATVIWGRTREYYRARPWRGTWSESGGGLLINQAIHTIDLLQWLLGDVLTLSGHAATHRLGDVIEVEDTAEMVLEHRGGARSVFFATNNNAVNSPVTIEIVAENGSAILRGDLEVTWGDGRVENVLERSATGSGRSYWGVSHQELIADFYAGHGSGERFWISPAEARKSLQILKEVYAQSPGPIADGAASAEDAAREAAPTEVTPSS